MPKSILKYSEKNSTNQLIMFNILENRKLKWASIKYMTKYLLTNKQMFWKNSSDFLMFFIKISNGGKSLDEKCQNKLNQFEQTAKLQTFFEKFF